MSMHREPQSPELIAALKQHGLAHDTPSQLSDAFRLGWNARAAEVEALRKRPDEAVKAIRVVRTNLDDVVCARGMFGVSAEADLQWAVDTVADCIKQLARIDAKPEASHE